MDRIVKVWNVGRINYTKGLKLQKYIVDLHRAQTNGINNTILLLEHDPVYTVGIRKKDYTKEEEVRLKTLGADFQHTNRGGLITFHGPGQLVVYPIINLRQFTPSVRWYVGALERAVIATCGALGLHAHTSPHTGVWVDERKVCAIGVHCSRYVTTHGLALNCIVDMSWYDHIVPCGIADKGVTSLSLELTRRVAVDEVAPLLVKSLARVFHCSYCYESVDWNVLNQILCE